MFKKSFQDSLVILLPLGLAYAMLLMAEFSQNNLDDTLQTAVVFIPIAAPIFGAFLSLEYLRRKDFGTVVSWFSSIFFGIALSIGIWLLQAIFLRFFSDTGGIFFYVLSALTLPMYMVTSVAMLTLSAGDSQTPSVEFASQRRAFVRWSTVRVFLSTFFLLLLAGLVFLATYK